MTPIDLLTWRKARKMTQAALAGALGVSRQTLNGWEAGKTMPGDLAERLMELEPSLPQNAPAGPAASSALVPKWINPRTAPHLYLKAGLDRWTRKPEHPLELLGNACVDENGYVPWGVLASDEYRAALVRTQSARQAKPMAGERGLPPQQFWDDLADKG